MARSPSISLAVGQIVADRCLELRDPGRRGRRHLADHHHVGATQVGLAGVVPGLVSGAVGIDQDDLEIRSIKGQVVVAAVPEHDVGLALGGPEDLLVVDAGEHHVAGPDVRLVLLHLFDGAVVPREIFEGGEALHGLRGEIAIGHRVAHDGDGATALGEQTRNMPRGRALADAGAHGAHADHGSLGSEHGAVRRQEPEARARRLSPSHEVHDGRVRHVAVGKDHIIDVAARDDALEIGLGHDGNAVGVVRPGQHGRVDSTRDVGDLGGGEGDDLDAADPRGRPR